MAFVKQNRGMGDYDRSGNYAWEFFPPPYDFLAPADSAPQPAPIMRGRSIRWGVGDYQAQAFATPQVLNAPMRDASIAIPNGWGGVTLAPPAILTKGLSGCGCGCNGAAGRCGGDDHKHGLGLFESGFDYTNWGIAEWVAVAGGGYLLLSLVGDVFTAKRGVERYTAKRRRRSAVRQEYQKKLAAI
jgi:hypothetical protein